MQFSKMHGLGNDFMIVDAITQNVFFSPKLIRRLADRHFGVGFDQLLLVESPYDPDLDFHCRIFNADGSEAAQCGNGIRCFARFVRLKGLTHKNDIHISTFNCRMILTIIKDKLVQVDMGEPNFEPSQILLNLNRLKKKYVIYVKKQKILFNVVSIGNSHCIIQVEDISTINITTLGSLLENHKQFPKRINIGFMQIVRPDYILLRVYERGIGETKACGSNACAAVAVGIIQGILSKKVCVKLPGGKLNISWRGPGYPLYMTGPAIFIYDGLIHYL